MLQLLILRTLTASLVRYSSSLLAQLHADNISKNQRLAINELKNSTNIKLYPFDKGNGFAILNSESAIQKIKEQLGNCAISTVDPTQKFLNLIQRTLSKLKKDKKLDKKTYGKIYSSDAIPPRLYGCIKAHKSEKGYPMRIIVSTIGTPPHKLSQHLVEIIQPTLNKNECRVKNSFSFVSTAKEWFINDEVQVSFDVINLYPSVPLDKATVTIIDMLNKDRDDLIQRTKLSLVDIHKLIDLCIKAYLQHIESNAIQQALNLNIAPKSYKRYVDDSHARFNNIDDANSFLTLLNSQDKSIQYTCEYENAQHQLNFLDICISTNHSLHKYEFSIHRKDAITNVLIKPKSCISPNIAVSIFKGFLARAYKICSEHNIQDEINFLIKVFTENGHSYKQYSDIAKNYKYSTNKSSSQKIDTKNLVILPWIPKLSLVLRREFRKVGVKTVFRFGNPLINILCRNKSKLPPNSHPGVYQLNCTCGSCYIGETRKKISTRIQEHKNNVTKANWETSGIVEHSQHCNGKINWENPKTLSVISNNYTRKIREAIEIQRVQCSKPKENVLNRDNGNLVMTHHWKPFFVKLKMLNI
ncbi:uncharacterized protein LOC136090921 [Hydra vulgaris]|uniref:Uncharacterized protein LOC136090921 n=1 Tax=Hydra vulgaris TaxID=6087 RepID=A0ABM4DHK9_HYDVU